jgi:hypothetical protein
MAKGPVAWAVVEVPWQVAEAPAPPWSPAALHDSVAAAAGLAEE